MIAILEALKEIEKYENNTTFAIYSDSLSSLKAIENPYNKNPIVYKIKVTIKQILLKHKIYLHHIKGHSNNDGNDMADKLANDARNTGTPIELKMSKKHIKNEIEKSMRDTWEEEWTQSTTDINTHSWIKSIHNIPEYFPTNYYQTQLITNHGKFPYYFKKIKKTEHSNCECGAEAEEFIHYIENCPITKTLGDIFLAKNPSGLTNDIKKIIIQSENELKILENIVELINKTISNP